MQAVLPQLPQPHRPGRRARDPSRIQEGAMSDPWKENPVTVTWNVPQWIVDYYRDANPDMPDVDAEWIVSVWLENMECNVYDVARDEGRSPAPLLGDESG